MAFGDLLHRVASFIGLEANERRSGADDWDDEEFDDYDEDETPRGSLRSSARYSPSSAPRSSKTASRSAYDARPSRPADDSQTRRVTTGSTRARDPYDNIVQLPLADRSGAVAVSQTPGGYASSSSHHSAMIVYVNRRDDAEQLINYVLEGKSVILSCERIDDATCQRVIDMLAGAAYAVEGHVEKISKGNYLFAPASVEIVSDAKAQPRFSAAVNR